MGQAASARLPEAPSSELYLPYDVLWRIVCDLDSDSLRKLSAVNTNINDITNARLWKTFLIDYDYDYSRPSERRRDILARCKALTRVPSRTQYVKYVAIQWDGHLGSHFGSSARSTCKAVAKSLLPLKKLEALQIHVCAHERILGEELSALADRFPFKLQRLTTSLSVQHNITRFVALQPSITFFECGRHERLKNPTGMKGPAEFPTEVLPNLRVLYTTTHRAFNLLAGRSLHTVEITNIGGHLYADLGKEATAKVEHFCVNIDTYPISLYTLVSGACGIIPSSIAYLHVSSTFPEPSFFSNLLNALTGLQGLEWNSSKKTSGFPRTSSATSGTHGTYFSRAIKACSEAAPTLNAIDFVTSTMRESWRAAPALDPLKWQRNPQRNNAPGEASTSGSAATTAATTSTTAATTATRAPSVSRHSRRRSTFSGRGIVPLGSSGPTLPEESVKDSNGKRWVLTSKVSRTGLPLLSPPPRIFRPQSPRSPSPMPSPITPVVVPPPSIPVPQDIWTIPPSPTIPLGEPPAITDSPVPARPRLQSLPTLPPFEAIASVSASTSSASVTGSGADFEASSDALSFPTVASTVWSD
ncbi:hypothetical protein DL93DRAFT_2165601 [Clavulina sp. PMI_390]|nr:hypothetical protein DL93DRAFT_2165601 [Clavulina sp. PMI_390]